MRDDILVDTWCGDGGDQYSCHFPFNKIEDLIVILNGSEVTNATVTKSGTIKLTVSLQKSDHLVIADRKYAIQLLFCYIPIGDEIANRKVGADTISQAYELIEGAAAYFEQAKVTLAETTQKSLNTINNELQKISARDQSMIQTSGHIDQQLAKMPQINQTLFRLEQAQQQVDGKIAQLNNALKTADDKFRAITEAQESSATHIQVMETLIEMFSTGKYSVPLRIEIAK